MAYSFENTAKATMLDSELNLARPAGHSIRVASQTCLILKSNHNKEGGVSVIRSTLNLMRLH